MNNSQKMLLAVVLLGAGVVYMNAELSKQPSLNQLLESNDKHIVCFDGLEVFNKATEVQEARKNLEAKFQEEGRNLQKLRTEAEKAASELQNMGSVATEKARRSKQEEAIEKENKVAIKERSLQQYAQQEMQRAEYEMAQKLKEYATIVAKEEGYKIVLAGGVAYADSKLDITTKIVTKWNNEYASKKPKAA